MTLRIGLATGLALSLGLAFVPLGCESWDRPTFTHVHALPQGPDPRELPDSVLRQIEDCARALPAPTPSEESRSNLIAFGVRVDESGKLRAVTLGRSTLGDRGVEACMVGALRGMTLPLDQPCEDEELARLEVEKGKLCNEGYTVNCKGDWDHPDDRKRLESVPCSQAMKSLQERLACLHHRNLIEDLCFGGVPDAGHAKQIDNVKRGIGHCKKMTEINCAEGHPMARF